MPARAALGQLRRRLLITVISDWGDHHRDAPSTTDTTAAPVAAVGAAGARPDR
ncbi:hypothetical protein O1L60_39275 [Streptomyces diastatochromogenes]|nr:hypothetical protein [Streptomyces diastatochromogenes]MCZ0982938.1 hypothetical protein [Streptomyces diastatochromogenes]